MKNSHPLRFFTLLAALMLVGLYSPKVTYAQEAIHSHGGLSATRTLADVARVSTVTVPTFAPYETALVHIREEYSGSLGTLFTYTPFDTYPISNLTYFANAGVTCSHDGNNTITCTGDITQVTIDFDFTYVVNDYLTGCLVLGWGGYSNYAIDFTIHLIYPAPLTYVGFYSTEPISVSGTEVTWTQENTTQLYAYALFRDPRISLVFLPMVKR